jgi:hypothetical protein
LQRLLCPIANAREGETLKLQKPKTTTKQTYNKARKLSYCVKECEHNRKCNQKQPESKRANSFYQVQVEFQHLA